MSCSNCNCPNCKKIKIASGCKNCANDYWGLDGTRQCKLEPHQYNTSLQRSIVDWLILVKDDSFTSAGCPGFRYWNE